MIIKTPAATIANVIKNEQTVRIDFLPKRLIKKYAGMTGAKFIKPIKGWIRLPQLGRTVANMLPP